MRLFCPYGPAHIPWVGRRKDQLVFQDIWGVRFAEEMPVRNGA